MDAGVFDAVDDSFASCRLEVAVEAVTSICHQAVKSRFALALPFFRKVVRCLDICSCTGHSYFVVRGRLQIVRKFATGFTAPLLHATLKSVIFIGDFDSALVKSVEDELVCKIMNRYESDRCEQLTATGKLPHLTPASSTSDMIRDFVLRLVDDVSSGVEIANTTEKMLGIFKVSAPFVTDVPLPILTRLWCSNQSHSSIHSPAFCADFALSMSAFIDSMVSNFWKQRASCLCILFCVPFSHIRAYS